MSVEGGGDGGDGQKQDQAEIEKRFEEMRRRLTDPDGEIALREFAKDPLGVGDVVREGMGTLMQDGVNVRMEEGMLVARDGEGFLHVMIVTEPKALPSDQAAQTA